MLLVLSVSLLLVRQWDFGSSNLRRITMTFYDKAKVEALKRKFPKTTKIGVWKRQRYPNVNKGKIL